MFGLMFPSLNPLVSRRDKPKTGAYKIFQQSWPLLRHSYSPLTRRTVGHHPDNFTDTAFDAVVQWVRRILEAVKPRRTKLTLEMSPWTLLDGPETYLRLLEAVNHPGLAVHLDPANAVRDPRTYYSTTELLNRCFDLLGPMDALL